MEIVDNHPLSVSIGILAKFRSGTQLDPIARSSSESVIVSALLRWFNNSQVLLAFKEKGTYFVSEKGKWAAVSLLVS